MRWVKKGLIFQPPNNVSWMCTHAMHPFADKIGDRHRVYFAGRDEMNRSQIGYFEINIRNPREIVRVSDRPVVRPGPLGSFDECGCNTPWIVDHNQKKYMYYTG